MNITIIEASPYYAKLKRALLAYSKKATMAERYAIFDEIKNDCQTLEDFADRLTSEEIDQRLRAVTAYVIKKNRLRAPLILLT